MKAISRTELLRERLILCEDDLLRARRFCKVLMEREEYRGFTDERVISEALSEALATTYSRMFTKSKTNTEDTEIHEFVAGKFTENRKLWVTELNFANRSMHDRILYKRNNSFAHTSGVSRGMNHSNDLTINSSHNPYIPYENSELSKIHENIEHFLSRVCRLRDNMTDGLLTDKSETEDSIL